MSNPVQAFVTTYNASLAGGVSAELTFSFAITQEFEAFIPIEVHVSANLSYGAEVRWFQSGDGGASWETVGAIGTVFDILGGAAEHTKRQGFKLPTGQYLIQVITGGGTDATYTVSLQTAWVISAYV